MSPTCYHNKPLDALVPSLQRRWQLLSAAQHNPPFQALLLEACRRSPVFFINFFCYTLDPRLAQPHQPFHLYPYQIKAVQTLSRAIDPLKPTDLLIEKSRDMGLSWLILLVFQHAWLFFAGANFLLGSRTEAMVDTMGDCATLFGKLRYNLALLPPWMRITLLGPNLLKKHTHRLLQLTNPALGNTITGESATGNFARGGRYRSILMDEFAFWHYDNAAYASAGQASPSRIVVSTPYGANNRFAQLRFNQSVPVLSLHWRLHPHKNEDWYRAQTERMSPDEIARELDLNYTGVLSNRIFPSFSERHKPTDLPYLEGKPVYRGWDFGFRSPAVVFVQQDEDGQLRVLREIIGKNALILDFAQQVKLSSNQWYPDAVFYDICDPAGRQRNDKHALTSIDILRTLDIWPDWPRDKRATSVGHGIELIRLKLLGYSPGSSASYGNGAYGNEPVRTSFQPLLKVHAEHCPTLVSAFEGNYCYTSADSEVVTDAHPWADVMDALRYVAVVLCQPPNNPRHWRKRFISR